MTDLGLHLRRAVTLIAVTLIAVTLPACEGKDGVLTEHTGSTSTAGDPSTGEPSNTTTDEPSTGKPADPSTGAPDATTGAPDASTGAPDATTGGPDDTTGGTSETGGEPPDLCESMLTKADCDAVPPMNGVGDPPCAWADVEVWDGDAAACAELGGAGRCVAMEYVGDGCGVSEGCDIDRLYYRDLGGGSFEAFAHPTTCGLEPIGWQQCFEDGPAVCDCFCDATTP